MLFLKSNQMRASIQNAAVESKLTKLLVAKKGKGEKLKSGCNSYIVSIRNSVNNQGR
ncbi:MAG: hypothetical protein ACLQO7_10455 [Candidatus Bathyarchaeia archaeon]